MSQNMGYKRNSEEDGDAVLTPNKAKDGKIATLKLREDDQLVVLAEDIRVKA